MEILPSISGIQDIKKLNSESLNQLAGELRNFIIDTVSKNGGHLASNLGVVELTLALHYVFDSPKDKLIFDVGHQCYTHKILTGRRDSFSSLRQTGGISGFPKTDESVHDAFNTGHSSTSISAALGMCLARDLKKQNYSVVSIIGDGSISGGMAFEGLNNIASTQTKMLVILNDNEMSISKNVGAVSDQLSKIRVSRKYIKFKESFKRSLENMPIFGKEIESAVKKTRNVFKNILIKGMIFEHFGLKYLGPIDGHNIPEMIRLMREAKKLNEPVLIHVITSKGKGLKKAELNPEDYHGMPPQVSEKDESFSSQFGKGLVDLAKNNEKVIAISAAMTIGTGLSAFEKQFKARFFDVGISEQHAVTMAAGLAMDGFRPYVAIYSTFIQRAYDQILHDVCLQNLPVTFCLDRGGLNSRDGETHHGIYDLAFLSSFPNIKILTPATYSQLNEALKFSESASSPVAIRYPSGEECLISCETSSPLEWQYIENNNAKTTILAVGSRMVSLARKVNDIKRVNIVCVTSVKPLDTKMLDALKNVITLEDAVLHGGFYSAVLEYYNGNKIVEVHGFGYPDRIIAFGALSDLMKEAGLTAEEIAGYAT